jgi:hypothetical protein
MKKLLFIFFLTFIHLTAKADSWTDPSWEKMIAESDAIALVEYISNGDFRARARIIKIYKGKVNSDIIWISGFSNRYGPIDKMKIGNRFIVFLNKNKPSKRNLEYWEEQIKEDKELITYVNALKNNNAYYVWTPTSGDLKIKSKKVQYDLIQTTFYDKQKFYSLKEFEQFLNSFNGNKKTFHNYLLSELSDNLSNDKASQILMMLYLTSYKKYDSIYEDIYKTNIDNSLYALAKLLGNVKGNSSRDLLVKLLDNENSIVQGEAVRQLSTEGSDFIGPILLSKLSKAGEDGIYSQNLMDPVQNSVDGGKIEIIKTLGDLKYKPAIPKLLPLLSTENEYLFMTTFNVLNKLGTKDYIPYLNSHLEKGTNDLIYEICDLITENNLTECIPSLMSYISNHDKTIHPSKEFTISSCCGLANFDNQEVREFLISDFKKVMKMKRGGSIDNKKDWLQEYFASFNQLSMLDIKSSLYNALFDYYGLNYSFKTNPKLFDSKKELEELTLKNIKESLVSQKIKKINLLVLSDYLNDKANTTDIQVNLMIETEKRGWDNLEPIFKSIKDNLTTYGLNANNFSVTTGSVTQSFGGMTPPKFSDSLMLEFLKYLSNHPDNEDLVFLQNLSKYGYAKSEYDIRKLNQAIEKVKTKLN